MTRKALGSERQMARKTRCSTGAISSQSMEPAARKVTQETIRLRPMASIGTPSTMAGRVQARKSGSSSRRSGVTASGMGPATRDDIDDRRRAEDDNDPHHHGGRAAEVQMPEHPPGTGHDY